MEKKLKKLFDYQHFEKNERLEKIIKETESRYGAELSDDDLSLVNAAGETGSIGGLTGDFFGNYTIPGKTQVGGLSGESKSGSVSGYNTGGLAGSLTDEVGGLIGTGDGGGGEGAGGTILPDGSGGNDVIYFKCIKCGKFFAGFHQCDVT